MPACSRNWTPAVKKERMTPMTGPISSKPMMAMIMPKIPTEKLLTSISKPGLM